MPQQPGWGQQLGGMPQQPGWGQQSGGMPPQQQGWGQQPGGMPQQPGWGQQQAWAPPAQQGQPSSSRRPLLILVLLILLIGLGTLTFLYTPIGDTIKDILQSTTGSTGTTVDTTPPEITNVRATDITTTKATIRWTTDDLSSSQVEYGTTEAYGSVMPAQPATDPSTGNSLGVIEHIVDLTDLQPDTTYHYKVNSKNADGLEGVSPDETFATTSAEE